MKSKMLLNSLVLGCLVFFSGCVGNPQPAYYIYAHYITKLDSVERPENAKKQYGQYQTIEISENNQTKHIFEDKLLNVKFFIDSDRIYFDLENKTDYSIKLIWDDMIFVDTEGKSSGVIHNGTKLINKDESQKATQIIRKGNYSDIIVPSNNIFYSKSFRSWQYQGIFQNINYEKSNPNIESINVANQYKNKKIQLLMPIEIEGIKNEYIFTFKVDNVVFK
jgi:hypothetical protein